MFEKLFRILKKQSPVQKEINQESKPQEVDIEVTVLGNIVKVDIKEDCTVMEYVPTMRKKGHEWIEDKIPNATLFDKNVNIKKKVIYLFEKENIRYSCYTTEDVIHINERTTNENNHIDERIITVYKKEDNYVISEMKHDENRSTYFVKSHEKKNPEYEFFQLGKDNANQLGKEVLSNLEKINGVGTLIDLDFIYQRLGLIRPKLETPAIKPIQNSNLETNKVKIKK